MSDVRISDLTSAAAIQDARAIEDAILGLISDLSFQLHVQAGNPIQNGVREVQGIMTALRTFVEPNSETSSSILESEFLSFYYYASGRYTADAEEDGLDGLPGEMAEFRLTLLTILMNSVILQKTNISSVPMERIEQAWPRVALALRGAEARSSLAAGLDMGAEELGILAELKHQEMVQVIQRGEVAAKKNDQGEWVIENPEAKEWLRKR